VSRGHKKKIVAMRTPQRFKSWTIFQETFPIFRGQ
jgi:hypothetical protein